MANPYHDKRGEFTDATGNVSHGPTSTPNTSTGDGLRMGRFDRANMAKRALIDRKRDAGSGQQGRTTEALRLRAAKGPMPSVASMIARGTFK